MELIDTTLKSVFSNKYSSSIITLFLVIYGGLAAPTLPKFVVKLFENPVFKILILSLIVYTGNKDPKLAIIVAIVFTVTLNMINDQQFLENFSDDIEPMTSDDIEPMTSDDIEPMTSDDIEPMTSDDIEPMTSDYENISSVEDCMSAGGDWDESNNKCSSSVGEPPSSE